MRLISLISPIDTHIQLRYNCRHKGKECVGIVLGITTKLRESKM